MTKSTTKTAPAAKTQAPAKKTEKKGWRIKQYYVDPKVYASADLSKAPNQVKIMMAHFAEKFNEPGKADQGKVLCQSAIDNAGLKTVIEPHVLFAYYARKMESLGLKLKG